MERLTPTGILYKFHQSGEIPQSMLPLQQGGPFEEDPTKPLRGAFEGILLARAVIPAFKEFHNVFSKAIRNTYPGSLVFPIEEIDEEEELDTRIELLSSKRGFVLNNFRKNLQKAMEDEMRQENRTKLPPMVAQAYGLLSDIDSPQAQVKGIMTAYDTLETTTADLFSIASCDYPVVLGYDPTARQMVDLVANSYETYVHPQTGIHLEVDTGLIGGEGVLGEKYRIDLAEPHKVSMIDISQYHRKEKQLRAEGSIGDQKIHCPFAMHADFTDPFLDQKALELMPNPLQYTFQRLVREYIGA